jgi:hypothetical protein
VELERRRDRIGIISAMITAMRANASASLPCKARSSQSCRVTRKSSGSQALPNNIVGFGARRVRKPDGRCSSELPQTEIRDARKCHVDASGESARDACASTGTQQLTATVAGSSSRAVFSASATAAMGRLEFVSQPAATAYTMYPLDRVPALRAIDAQGNLVAVGQVTASAATPGYSVRTGAVEPLRSDGTVRFSSMSIGVAPGYIWTVRTADTVRLRFDMPGFAPVFSDLIQLSCKQTPIAAIARSRTLGIFVRATVPERRAGPTSTSTSRGQVIRGGQRHQRLADRKPGCVSTLLVQRLNTGKQKRSHITIRRLRCEGSDSSSARTGRSSPF